MSRSATLLAILLVAMGCAHRNLASSLQDPVQEELRLSIEMIRRCFTPGQRVPVRCSLQNVSDRSIRVETPLVESWAESYLEVLSEDGKFCPRQPVFDRYRGLPDCAPDESCVSVLDPGGILTYELDLLEEWPPLVDDDPSFFGPYEFAVPGSYQAQCWYRNLIEHEDPDVWRGSIGSEPVPFRLEEGIGSRNELPELCGLRIDIELRGDRFAPKEPIPVTCTLTNLTRGTLRLEKPHLVANQSAQYVRVLRGPAWEQLLVGRGIDIHWGMRDAGSDSARLIPLGPGETIQYRVDLAEDFEAALGENPEARWGPHTVEVPAPYSVQCHYWTVLDYGDAVMWRGAILSEPVRFEVVEAREGESTLPDE